MLKGINKLIIGDLLKVLCDMGHGDTISIVDANYPAHTKNKKIISFPGQNTTDLLQAILELIPLDHIVDSPAFIMDLELKDKESGMKEPEIWNEFNIIISKYTKNSIKKITRQEFYDISENSSIIVQTGEERLYGDIILVKGVL